MRKATTFFLITACVAMLSVSSRAQEVFKGEWLGRFENNKVWLSLKPAPALDHSVFGWSLNLEGLEIEKVKGLTAAQTISDVSPIRFELTRDAGTVVFDGVIKKGSAIGDYQYTPNQDYINALRAMGYDNLSSEQLLRLTLRDVSRGFIKEMRSAGYETASIDQMVRLRNHNITTGFIREMKALGLEDLSVDRVVRLRNHQINGAFIQEMKSAGYDNLSVDELVRMRNHKVDVAYIKSLGEVG